MDITLIGMVLGAIAVSARGAWLLVEKSKAWGNWNVDRQ